MRANAHNDLIVLQETLYRSTNYTRKRLHNDRLLWVSNAINRFSDNLPSSVGVEYGPGSGIYLPLLSNKLLTVIASDSESLYLERIKCLYGDIPNLSLCNDDIQNSSIKDCSVGLVLCTEVLEHIQDPELALKTLYRILKPGGIAIVTTPQRYSIIELSCKIAFLPILIDIVRKIYNEPILQTGHISLQSFSSMNSMINTCGFDIIEHNKFGLYIPLLCEFGGRYGGRIVEFLEEKLSFTRFSNLFWTQAYVLRKPHK